MLLLSVQNLSLSCTSLTLLGSMLVAANHTIVQVFGRNPQTLAECAARLHAQPIDDVAQINAEAEVCIIATSDNAVASIAAQLYLPGAIVMHTSGGVAMSVLNKHQQHGVLYPLQSLRKELPYLPKVPLYVDGNKEDTKIAIAALSNTISGEVHFAGDEERLKLHVAAVFCSNFTNHLFALAHHFCNGEQLRFNHLQPLIQETVHRMQYDAPERMQTGPAIRRDEATLQRHLQVLDSYPLLAQVYKMLTQSIQQWDAKR